MKEKKVLIVAKKDTKQEIIEKIKKGKKEKWEVKVMDPSLVESNLNLLREHDAIYIPSALEEELKRKVFSFAFENDKEIYIESRKENEIFKKQREEWGKEKGYHFSKVKLSPRQAFQKRSLDLILSSMILILTSPFLLLTAIIIKLDSNGPAVFKQKRVGKDGKEFVMYKFRSMKVEAKGEEACKVKNYQVTSADSDKITKVGAFIRKTKWDELLQFVNVLKGDMSIVGPRPEIKGVLKQIKEILPEYELREKTKPGITGLAHVYGNYQTDIRKRLSYDISYMTNHTLLQDIKIIGLTIKVMLKSLFTEKEMLS